jgi:hypothetical protein
MLHFACVPLNVQKSVAERVTVSALRTAVSRLVNGNLFCDDVAQGISLLTIEEKKHSDIAFKLWYQCRTGSLRLARIYRKLNYVSLGFRQTDLKINKKSTRSRKVMFLGSRAWLVRRADNLTIICEPIA